MSVPVPMCPPVLLDAELADAAALRQRLGVAAYARLQRRHADLFATLCAASPGAAVRRCNGDGCRAAFGTVEDAAWFAAQFEQAVRAEPWAGGTVTSRIAIHLNVGTRDADPSDERGASSAATAPAADEPPPDDALRRLRADLYPADEPAEIGPYRIVRVVGEGGMGV